MLTQIRTFFTGLRLVVAIIVLVGAFAAGGLATWWAPRIGAAAQIAAGQRDAANWKAAYASWKRYGEAEKRAFDDSERLRRAERGDAQAALSGSDAQCTARLEAARASAAAINRIIQKEPAHDPQTGCPVRRLADPGELRDALRPRTGPGR